MRIKWSENTEPYTNGSVGKCGKWILFTTHWDASYGKGYDLTCKLSGIKRNLGTYAKHKEAEKQAEFIFSYWMEYLQKEDM